MTSTSYSMDMLSNDLREAVLRTKFIAFDFDGVFTNNAVYVLEDGREAVLCNRSDGIGLAKLRPLGVEAIIISTEPNSVVQVRSRKLKIPCISDCDDKRAALTGELERRDLDLAQAAFVGNDVNDLACLKVVGLPIVVRDAHPDVLPFALYRTLRGGGGGAVREICDLFEAVQGAAGGVRRD